MVAESRAANCAEHDGQRRLRRISRISRIAFGRRQSSGRNDLPSRTVPGDYPVGLLYYPSGAPLANPAVSNTTHWFSEGISSYNGLEADVNQRLSHGLQFRGVYTFSKSLDDGDNLNTSVATNSPAFIANPLNPSCGLRPGIVRHSSRRRDQRNLRSSIRQRALTATRG